MPQAKRTVQQSQSGKHGVGEQISPSGHTVGAVVPNGPARDVALSATLRAAALRHSALHLPAMGSFVHELGGNEYALTSEGKPRIQISDLRVKRRYRKQANLRLFVVDSSGSMGARKRMAVVKGVILSLLGDAYRKRDRVGMIVFRGEGARLFVPPTNSVNIAERQLRQLPTGGKTPLGAGLQLAAKLLGQYLRHDSALTPQLLIVTDGRGNVGPSPSIAASALATKGYPTVVLDSEQGYVKLGDARQLAATLGATYASLEQIEQVVGSL